MRSTLALLSLPLVCGAAAFQFKFQIPGVLSSLLALVGYEDSEFPSQNHVGAPNTSTPACSTANSYWLEHIHHQGVSAFNTDRSYQVFRNVKDFGAKGDGVTDDTAAIQQAISSGGRCAPGSCQSSTITPAVVYFPTGTYLISSSIIDYYNTQIIGNPNDLPTLLATPNFVGFGVIDGDQYQPGGSQGFGSTNLFFRQIRNIVIDITNTPSASEITGIHWPTAQATSLQNIVFRMSDSPGTQHRGLFIENGSGGFMSDLDFYGGLRAAWFGNQQFTMRNLRFYNAVTAINQLWDWGWTYQSITVENCSVGIDMTLNGADRGPQTVGSITIIDSTFRDTPIAIKTAHTASSQPPTGGSLIIENVLVKNVATIVQSPDGVILSGSAGTTTVSTWGQGHSYINSAGPVEIHGPLSAPISRPTSLLTGDKYYQRSKPQYRDTPESQIWSTRIGGALGDGTTDDTAALQNVLDGAASEQAIVFFDAGTYKITKTLYIPPNSRVVGESYSVIMSSGNFFENINDPQPVVRVGNPGQAGMVEWSDMIVSTQGPQAGAILIEWNLASDGNVPSGMWDVHARVGGFTGSELQVAQCPKTPNIQTPPEVVNERCICAFLSMHITKSASNLYLENVWIWTADHDLDDATSTQISIFSGRGLLVESASGKIWLVGTSVEHHALYQYQFVNTRDIFMGHIQTETPYYQPNPPAPIPFQALSKYHDPDFANTCFGLPSGSNCAMAWGLRIIDSTKILVYGAGLYSFFDNYSTSCSTPAPGPGCQRSIVSVIIRSNDDVGIYTLNTVGVIRMIDLNDGSDDVLALAKDNRNTFADTVAWWRSAGV